MDRLIPNQKSALSSAFRESFEAAVGVTTLLLIIYAIGFIGLNIVIIGFLAVQFFFTIALYNGWGQTQYEISEPTINKRINVIGEKTESITRSSIETIDRTQSWWQKRYNVGTVIITTKTDKEMKLQHISDWETVLNDVDNSE